jgi:hypothetical protein
VTPGSFPLTNAHTINAWTHTVPVSTTTKTGGRTAIWLHGGGLGVGGEQFRTAEARRPEKAGFSWNRVSRVAS